MRSIPLCLPSERTFFPALRPRYSRSLFAFGQLPAHTLTCRALQHSLGTARRRSFPPLNLHRAPRPPQIAGGFLQVVVSKAREHTVLVQAHCLSRFRYNPKTSHYFSCWSRPKFGKSIKLTFFPSTLTHPEPRLLIASHHEAIHDAGRS
jgi:hypothetical protein